MRVGARPEPVAEIRAFLVAHFLGAFFVALTGQTRIVEMAQTAAMQPGATLRAFRLATQRQGQCRQRSAAFPANQVRRILHRYRDIEYMILCRKDAKSAKIYLVLIF
jgi:hypothetical protein